MPFSFPFVTCLRLYLLLVGLVISLSVAAESTVIHLNAAATPAQKKVAEELAERLKLATDNAFSVTTSDKFTGQGFYLTLRTEDQYKQAPAELAQKGPEGMYLKGSDGGAYIVGNSELALMEAAELYLENLGFRYYLPHPVWHITPKVKSAYLPDLDLLTKPAYESRQIWFAYGTDSKTADRHFEAWKTRNRMGGSFKVAAGHAWPGIVKRNKAAFDAHPEYSALMPKGHRDTTRYEGRKLCTSNEGLVQLVIADALSQIRKSKETGKPDDELQMVSVDPSDGAYLCTCKECEKLGSGSDKVFYLANRVAKAVGEKYPSKWVGLYAYSTHSEPTRYKLEPNVFVGIATAFNNTKLSYDALIKAWGEKATRIGIRDYYGVMAWDWDMPGQARGARVAYAQTTIPKYHSMGAVAMSAETNIGWISRGLGHYVAAKLLWDPQASSEAIVEDFYAKLFGKARKPLQTLFEDWQHNPNVIPTSNDLANWFRLVAEAEKETGGDAALQDRLDQIKYYLHYVALFHDYKTVESDENHEALTEMLRYAWRTRDLGTSAFYPLARRLTNAKAPTPEHKFNNKKAIWKSNPEPVSTEELNQLIKEDLARYQPVKGLKNAAYSKQFEPAAANARSKVKPGAAAEGLKLRGPHSLIITLPASGDRKLEIAIGAVVKNKQPGTVKLYPLGQETDDANDQVLYKQEITPDGALQTINWNAISAGTYRLEIEDHRDGIQLKPGAGIGLSIEAGSEFPVWSIGRNDFYFWVPAKTEAFAITHKGPISFRSPKGRVLKFDKTGDPLVRIEVKKDEGGLWQIENQSGKFYLMGIPAFVSPTAEQLLKPQGADAQ